MLELDRVAKLYGAKVIFKDVSCAFASGSVSLLVGGNGAGKSTLMRIMAGLSRPSAGSVRLAESGPRAEGPRLGYLGHATFLYPGLTALENLAFWRTAHGLRLSGAGLSAMLERVGLAAHAHERAGIFSRGMAQRLNLARVLMLEPDLLLLDEPAAGMNPQETLELASFIREIRDHFQKTILLIEHHMDLVMGIADRIYVLDFGKLIAQGTPEEIQNNERVIDAYLGVADDAED